MPCALSRNVEAIIVTDFDCFADLLVNGSHRYFVQQGGGGVRYCVSARMFLSRSFDVIIMAKRKSSDRGN